MILRIETEKAQNKSVLHLALPLRGRGVHASKSFYPVTKYIVALRGVLRAHYLETFNCQILSLQGEKISI